MENLRIEEPEPRLSNTSNNRPGVNTVTSMQTQFHMRLKNQT